MKYCSFLSAFVPPSDSLKGEPDKGCRIIAIGLKCCQKVPFRGFRGKMRVE
jgi:hypothetical protein